MKMIKDILAKYENFYKGGSGYTFQVEVDDFNVLLQYIEANERLLGWNDELQAELIEKDEKIEALEKEIIEHCETKGLAGRQVFTLTKRVDELVEENKKLKENEVFWTNKFADTKQLLTKEPPRISIKPEKSGTPLLK
jgi:predicted nuclease with TOPRIM domain